MVVEPIFIIAGVLILLVSLILTAAFFVLNDRLESENHRMKKLLEDMDKGWEYTVNTPGFRDGPCLYEFAT